MPSNWEQLYPQWQHQNIWWCCSSCQVEEDRLHAEKPVNEAFISEIKMRGAYDSKYKKCKGKGKGPKYDKKRI